MSLGSKLRNIFGRNSQDAPPTPSMKASQLLLQGLQELQAPHSDPEGEDDHTHISFQYQGATFLADILEEPGIINICFPGIGVWDITKAPVVTRICNDMSQHTFGCHITSRVDGTRLTVDMYSIIWTLQCVSLTDTLAQMFRLLFTMQREVVSRIDNNNDNTPIDKTFVDMMAANAVYLRDKTGSLPDLIEKAREYAPLTVLDILKLHYDLEPEMVQTVMAVVINDDGNARQLSAEEASSLVLVEQLPPETDGPANVALHYRLKISGEEIHRSLTIVLRRPAKDSNPVARAVAYSMSMTPRLSRFHDTDNKLFFRLPAEKPLSEYAAEVKFMKDDAIDKIREGHEDELSEPQWNLIKLGVIDLDEHIYNGTKAFSEEEYAVAAYHLNAVADYLLSHSASLKSEQIEASARILYLAGVANSRIGNIARSFFYLDPISQSGNLYFSMALIDTLYTSGDFRARLHIENLLSQIDNAERDAKADEGEEDFYERLSGLRFGLSAKLVELYIKDLLFDEAETILIPMKDGPHSEYAKEKLAEIERERESNAPKK